MSVRRVTILNTEQYTKYQFTLLIERFDRLRSLVDELKAEPNHEPEWPGVDSAAVVGMGTLFEGIPAKFPLQDVLNFLRDEIDPSLSSSVVEKALIRLARS